MFHKIKGFLHIHKDNVVKRYIQVEKQSTNRKKKQAKLLRDLPSPHPKKDKNYSPALTSTASESCQKRQRIQNHMVALKNSALITWDLVSWGNCLYWGSICTPPPALHDKTKMLSSLLYLQSTNSSKTLSYIQKLNLSHLLHEIQNGNAPQPLEILLFHKLALNLCGSKNWPELTRG